MVSINKVHCSEPDTQLLLKLVHDVSDTAVMSENFNLRSELRAYTHISRGKSKRDSRIGVIGLELELWG